MTPNNSRAYTPNDLARRYGVSVHKILVWVASGQLRAINLAGAESVRPRWKILPDDLVDFEQRRAAIPTPKPAKRRKKSDNPVIEFF